MVLFNFQFLLIFWSNTDSTELLKGFFDCSTCLILRVGWRQSGKVTVLDSVLLMNWRTQLRNINVLGKILFRFMLR